ncbi:MAG: hypothetical protein ABW223_00055 [Rariglobus sp.]
MNRKTLTLLRFAAVAAVAMATALSVRANASLLQDFVLPGNSSVVEWTNLSSTSVALAPSTGSGSIAVETPGGKSGMGFYSYTGHYSFTAATTAVFDVANVILQYSGGWNPDYSFETYLSFDQTSPTTVKGPVLSYTLSGGGSGQVNATFASVLSGPVTVFVEAVGMEVAFYDYAWQWDLSSIAGTITGVSIVTDVPVHTSVTGVQIALGDTFASSAIPEPSAYAAIAGALILAGACMRRGKRAAA